MNNFYPYAYLREDGTPYYIGKGRYRRAYSTNRTLNVPPKDRIIFLKQNLTEEEAFKHEIYMIAVFGRKDLGTGILRNKTDGGEGGSGRVVPNEEIERQKIVGKWCVENKIGFHGCSEEYMTRMRMKGTIKSVEVCSKKFVVKNLSGNFIEGKNVSKFCRDNGFNTGNFLMMLYGKQTMAYGYVLPQTQVPCYKLLSPSGDEYTITKFDRFIDFCEKHNLTQSGFGRMISGKCNHKGWKLLKVYNV